MADLKQIQEQIRQRRDAFQVADNVYYQQLQQLALSQKSNATANPSDLKARRKDREDARLNLHAAINLLTLSDTPQQLLTQIAADIPFLLLPLRVEARYITFRHVVRHLKSDDCIDTTLVSGTFEQEEEGNWTYQVPQLQSGLLNELATKIKSQQIQPKSKQYIERKPDKEELCIRFYPDEIFKYAHEPNLMPAEWEAGIAFWHKLFTLSEPAEKTWLNFVATMSPSRAAWVVRMTQPVNFTFGQTFPAAPEFPPNPQLKEGAYTLPPTTQLLPERIVVRLYDATGAFKEFIGKSIPDPIRLGLDPTDDPFDENPPGAIFVEQNGTLIAPEYLQWVQNLEVAEQQGLAIRVDLTQHPEFKDGVERIIVVGAKLSANETVSTQLLNEHFENCLYKEDGMAILPQGTLTNNFGEQKSGFNLKETASLAYFQSTFLAPKIHPQGLESDESFLRRLLGLNTSFRLPNGDQTDIDEAKKMNSLLWHATWGYSLLQFFSPAMTEPKREMLRQFFNQNVTGRGLLPVLRINRQPYGIVPTTNWSLWQYSGNSDEEKFLSKVWSDFLSALKSQWGAAAVGVNAVSNTATSGGNLDAPFLDMLSLTASSTQFQGQILAGAEFKSILQKLLDEVNADLTPIHNMQTQQESQLATVNAQITQKENEIQKNNALIAGINVIINTPFLERKLPHKVQERTALAQKNTVLITEVNALTSRRTSIQSIINSALPRKKLLSNSQSQLTSAIQRLKDIAISNVRANFSALPATSFENVAVAGPLPLPNFLIDSLPLSEEGTAEKIAGKSWNFIEWLLNAKLSEVWNNQTSSAPAGDGDPESHADTSLFAFVTRQALLRALLENQLKLTESNPGLWLLKARDFELEQLETGGEINVNPLALDPGNLLHQQYKPVIAAFQAQLTTPVTLKTNRQEYVNGLDSFNLQQWIQQSGSNPVIRPVADLEKALQTFKDLPTARLERLFTEHLDLCTYRLDAWMSGLIHQRLDKQRKSRPQGIQLGAFGYLLGLKPKNPRDIVAVNVEPTYMAASRENFDRATIPVVNSKAAKNKGVDLATSMGRAFFYIGESANPRLWLNLPADKVEADTLINKARSDGFIHMPSLVHATTAAIMRAGYLAHRADTQTESLSINLTAPRVRKALQMMEGMQAGTPLTELLGHLFERALHDHGLDTYRFEFRKAFPLQEDLKTNGKTTLMASLDGLALLKAFQSSPSAWLTALINTQGQVLTIPPADKDRLTEIARLMEDDYLDSTGDLFLTESVYQTAKGNADRAAAALRSLNTGGQTLLPDFVKVPQKGHGLTHRVGIVFPKLNATEKGNVWTIETSPRTTLAPSLNKWLARQLPPPARILIAVTLPDGSKTRLSLAEIGIEPIDLLYHFPLSFRKGATCPLHLWVQLKVLSLPTFKDDIPEIPVSIDFRDRSGFDKSEVCIHEISALLLNLKKILELSRSLQPADTSALGNVSGKMGLQLLEEALKNHVNTSSIASMLPGTLRTIANTLRVAISENHSVKAQRSACAAFCGPLLQAAQFGIEEAGSEGSVSLDPERFNFLMDKAEAVAVNLEKRVNDLKKLLTELSTDENQRFQQLQQAGKVLLGKDALVYPDIELTDTNALQTAVNQRRQLLNTDADTIDNWLSEAALVRKPLRHFRQVCILREVLPAVENAFIEPIVTQLPFLPQVPWIGNSIKETDLEKIAPELRPNTSIFLETPEDFKVNEPFTGLLLDEWSEFIPSATTETGLAFQYDQPNTEPAQVMLLAISPVEGGNWQWEYLMGAVEEALQMAKSRLVTPEELKRQNKVFGDILPALVMPFLNNQTRIPETELIKPMG
jgi:hypothetical protein